MRLDALETNSRCCPTITRNLKPKPNRLEAEIVALSGEEPA